MRGLPERNSAFGGLGDLVPDKSAKPESDVERRARRRREAASAERDAGTGEYGIVVDGDGKFRTTRHP